MGKNDNIKRAKKLREAKRKRERIETIASDNGPAKEELQERIEAKGGKPELNSGKIKYSDLLKSFVEPILDDDDPIEIVKTKYLFAIVAWNAAITKEFSEEEYLLEKENIFKIIAEVPDGKLLFEGLIKRKQEEFSEYKNIIVDFEIKKISGPDYELIVAMAPFNGKKPD